MMFILNITLLLSSLLLSSFYKNNQLNTDIGSIYNNKINIPFIGYQFIEAEVKNNTTALIKLEGMINEVGIVKCVYNYNEPVIEFSNNINKIMNKYNSELSAAYYDNEKDKIIFNINVKSIKFKKRIILNKVNKD